MSADAAPYRLVRAPRAADLPPDAIHSQVVARDGGVNVTVFAFGAGASLTEHTSARAALLQVVTGEVGLEVAGTRLTVGAGDLVRLEPSVPHALVAPDRAILVLTLLPRDGA